MATLVQNFLDLADTYKREGGYGAVPDIIEMMNDTSQDIFTDFVMMQCNMGTKHRHGIRTGLPDVSWGALYEGIPQSKSKVQQVDDTTGFVEQLASVDKRLLQLSKDPVQLRLMESRAFIEAMSQELVTAFFYHNTDTNARYPKGLDARFGTIATSGAGNQIVDAQGSGSDNTSIWMVTWGYDGVCALYPEGVPAGIQTEDKGEQRVTDDSGNPYYVMEEMFSAHIGFAVKDWRMVSCVRNIDVSDMQAGSVDLYGYLRKAYYKHHGRRIGKVRDQAQPGRTVIYCNRDVLEALDGLATNDGASDSFIRLRPMEIEGKEVMTYRGIPIRETDAILNTEAQVT